MAVGYKYDSVYYEDVQVGQDVPTLRMPITVTKLIMNVAASRDFQPMHHDRDFAKEQSKTRDMFIGTWFFMGICSRFVTDWAGPNSNIHKLKFHMKQPVCPGDDFKVDGKVIDKKVEDGKSIAVIDVQMSTQFGLTTTATIEAALPSRN